MTLTYATLIEHRTPEQIADLDAYLEGRELPSVIRQREERQEKNREFLTIADQVGGEVG